MKPFLYAPVTRPLRFTAVFAAAATASATVISLAGPASTVNLAPVRPDQSEASLKISCISEPKIAAIPLISPEP